MESMEEHRYLPDANRVSVVMAVVLLAYVLTRLIDVPAYSLDLQLPGFFFSYELNISTVIALLAAALTAIGMDWLLRSHPAFQSTNTVHHWLLPALTAWAVGVMVDSLPAGTLSWVGFVLGGLLLLLAILAEYVVVNPSDARYAAAMAVLTAQAFALYLVLATALHFAEVRLFIEIPTLFVAAGLVSLRALQLHLNGRWDFAWAAGIALASSQLAAALHYWPLTPVQFGLMMFGPVYALTSLASNLADDVPARRALVEPLLVLVLAWGGAFWLGA